MRRLMILGLAMLLGGCATGFQVSTDYNIDYDFNGKTSYAIVLPEKLTTVPNPLVSRRVMRAIRTEMDERGYLELPPNQADIHFSYITTSKDREDVRLYQNYNSYYAYRACWRCGIYIATTVPVTEVERISYVESQIIIDVIDPISRELVWRGMTNKRFERSEVATMDPEKLTKIVNEAVDAILKRYPPVL